MIALLALLVLAPPEGTVRVAYATTLAVDATPARTARAGSRFSGGAQLTTEDDGYAEVQLGADTRVRLSASTRIFARERALDLVSGRMWIQVGARERSVDIGSARVRLEPRTSAIVERAPTGVTVAVRVGRAFVATLDGELVVEPGMLAQSIGPRAATRRGGAALWNLVIREARDALGDLGGLERFLVERALRRRRSARRADAEDGPFAGYPERVRGANGGAAGLLLEEAIRPPPFFEDEVPPKGPNVRVDVGFTEE